VEEKEAEVDLEEEDAVVVEAVLEEEQD